MRKPLSGSVDHFRFAWIPSILTSVVEVVTGLEALKVLILLRCIRETPCSFPTALAMVQMHREPPHWCSATYQEQEGILGRWQQLVPLPERWKQLVHLPVVQCWEHSYLSNLLSEPKLKWFQIHLTVRHDHVPMKAPADRSMAMHISHCDPATSLAWIYPQSCRILHGDRSTSSPIPHLLPTQSCQG